MPAIHEVATITSKGQITLPKPIRQALGVDAGGKVAFDFTGDRVIVTRVTDEPHEDPAIGNFLAFDDPNLVRFRGQDHSASSAAQHSRHAYSTGTHKPPPAQNCQ